MLRTHTCGEPRAEHIGQEVVLAGWVDAVRDFGGVSFVSLRDRHGRMQVTLHPEVLENPDVIREIKNEQTIRVWGEVQARPDGMKNAKMPTGDVELSVKRVEVLGDCPRLPVPISDQEDEQANEELRLQYRYLDLRRDSMQDRFRFRSDFLFEIRTFLRQEGFIDLETPTLTRSTPEGARDFLVPSRMSPGQFYALPQSPQIFKQIFMVAGFDRYMQVVKCFRDEDLRADRQLEFTQLDLELSFVEEDDVMDLVERLVRSVMKTCSDVDVPDPLPRITYAEAMERYGCDNPDVRFGLELVDVTEIAGALEFRVFSGAVEAGAPSEESGSRGAHPCRARTSPSSRGTERPGGQGPGLGQSHRGWIHRPRREVPGG